MIRMTLVCDDCGRDIHTERGGTDPRLRCQAKLRCGAARRDDRDLCLSCYGKWRTAKKEAAQQRRLATRGIRP